MKTNLIFLCISFWVIAMCNKSEAQEVVNPDDSVAAYLKEAQSLARQGNTLEASRIYSSLMEREPGNRDAVQGWLMINMKRTPDGEEKAIILLDSLNKLYPQNTGIVFFRAFVEAEYGHNEEALKDAETLIKILPDDALHHILKGQVLYEMKKYDEAIKAFDIATSLDTKRPDIWGMKAAALAKSDRFDEAVSAINKGLELDPNNLGTLYNRACIFCLKGDKTNAIADLKKAISMNPTYKDYAKKDEDFKTLYEDEDFKKLIL